MPQVFTFVEGNRKYSLTVLLNRFSSREINFAFSIFVAVVLLVLVSLIRISLRVI